MPFKPKNKAPFLFRGSSLSFKATSFFDRSKKERIGRNPKTGQDAIISERKVVSCKFSKNLKIKINNDY